jgi:hypothetical protein
MKFEVTLRLQVEAASCTDALDFGLASGQHLLETRNDTGNLDEAIAVNAKPLVPASASAAGVRSSEAEALRRDPQKLESLVQLAAQACTDLRDLRMGWPWRELGSDGQTLPELVKLLRGIGIDDEGGWDCDLTQSQEAAA